MSKFVTKGELSGILAGLTAAQGTVRTVGGLSPDASGNVSSVKSKFQGTVTPVFQNINGFDNLGAALPATAFAVSGSGGLISSSGGTAATGYKYLPRAIASSTPTRTDFLIDWDPAETGASITVALGLSSGTTAITITNTGGTVQVTLNNVGGTTTNYSDTLTGRQPFCLSFATGNGGITESVSLMSSLPALGNTSVYRAPISEYQHMPAATRISMIYCSTNCTSSRIVGFLHNSNGLDGDSRIVTQTVIKNLAGIANYTASAPGCEHENIMIVPYRANLNTPLRTVLFFHGRTGSYADMYSVSNSDHGDTFRYLLNAGYAYVADSGGLSTVNRFSDWWGNQAGLQRVKQTWDAFDRWVTNVGKIYIVGWSMGAACGLNFDRQYHNLVAALEIDSGVTNLEDQTATYGVQIQATLKASVDLAYQCYWTSQLGSNLNNDPATDNGTNWKRASDPGTLPDVGFRSYQVTTVSGAQSNVSTVALASGTPINSGDYVYFRGSCQQARVISKAAGVPNSINLDRPVTVLASEPVCLIRLDKDGNPDALATDFAWTTTFSQVWLSGTTYAVAGIACRNTSHPELDVRPNNPFRFPECFDHPIKIATAGATTGGPTDNDGILGNQMMFDFKDLVNAIYPGTAVIRQQTGSHVGGALNPSDTLAFFNAN